MSGADGHVLLGAPLPAVRRALKLQHADAIFGLAGKRRVRLFADALDAAALTVRISRARVLAFAESETTTVIAVWRAGKQKFEASLPRVLRTPAELREGTALGARLAAALETEARGVLKAGTASLDLAAGIAGVGGAELRGLSHAELLRRAEAIAALPSAQRAEVPLAALLGLRHLVPDGSELPLLPLWAEEGKKLVARSINSARELLERFEELDADSLSPNQRVELEQIASGALPFPVTPEELIQLRAVARTLLGG